MYYTKYRPQKFSEISKPNDTAKALQSQLKTNKTSHAYLFIGSRGTGKTTTARILAKSLNCQNLDDEGDPCLDCDICNAVKLGTFVDLYEIDAASNRGIDDIRDLRDKIKLSPAVGKKKVYIIDEVHMLTSEAFNALLKTLEEPPEHAVFILCTTEAHKIPDTIKSRCQVYKFKRATTNQIVERLKYISKQEGVNNLTDEFLTKVALASFGGFRDAETLLQQVVEGSLDPDSFVGLSAHQNYIDFVDTLIKKDVQPAFRIIRKLIDDGTEMSVWIFGLLNYLRDILFIKAKIDEELVDVSKEIKEQMYAQASKLSYKSLTNYLNTFIAASNKIEDSMLPQLPLEVSVVEICKDLNTASDTTQKSPDLPEIPEKTLNSVANDSLVSVEVEDYGEDFFDYNDEDAGEDMQEEKEIIVDAPPVVELTIIEESWKVLLTKTSEINASIHTLLKSASPIEVTGNKLIIEVLYKFHKDRLEAPRNRVIIEKELLNLHGSRLYIECRVNTEKRPKKKTPKETGELTDYNISAPVFSSDNPDNINDIFDGALPM